MGDEEEGKVGIYVHVLPFYFYSNIEQYHASIIVSSDLVLFREIVDAYFDRKMYEDMKVIYELLGVGLAVSMGFLVSCSTLSSLYLVFFYRYFSLRSFFFYRYVAHSLWTLSFSLLSPHFISSFIEGSRN
ncbi:hypothetical protein BJ165DRAFT_669434 [Panaeolus papilionaceus]|nr:hypothetical protein BJ165DRAFT_669434 [Panaeolus papilionaceus]